MERNRARRFTHLTGHILPAPEVLVEACKRAAQTEGINTPLPPQTEGGTKRGEGIPYPSENDARLHAQDETGEPQNSGTDDGRVRFTL